MCYQGQAHGGDVESFCSKDQPHKPECEYFKSGGEVIPNDQVVLDEPAVEEIPADQVKMDEEIPSDQVIVDNPDDEIPNSQVILDSDKYSTPGQTIAAGLEGAAQGIAGPLAPMAEIGFGLATAEEIAAREKANPTVHAVAKYGTLAGSMLTGLGEAKAIAWVAEHAAPAITSKIGSKMLNRFIQGMAFTGSDEITKNLLHQNDGDPESTVATALTHMATTGVLTMATGGIFDVLGKVNPAVSQGMIERAQKFLSDIAETKNPVGKALAWAAQAATGYEAGSHADSTILGINTYAALRKWLGPKLEEILNKPLGKANAYVTDALISAIGKDSILVPKAAQWGTTLAKGGQAIIPAIDALFTSGAVYEAPKQYDSLMKELRQNVEEGSLQTEIENEMNSQPAGYAHGGAVKQPHGQSEPDHFGTMYPEANVLLNQAKGRVYKYLNSVRPLPDAQKLPFDDKPSDKEKERSYNKALELAVNPVAILHHVNKGDLTVDQMKHFVGLYPEVHKLFSKKITEGIVKAQLDGKKPSYAKRQAMSLFLGAPLDSTMTPSGIQAAQAVFAQKQNAQQAQAPQPKKKGKSSLSKTSGAYLTDDQARQARQQKV